jgi:hypothetical protein
MDEQTRQSYYEFIFKYLGKKYIIQTNINAYHIGDYQLHMM